MKLYTEKDQDPIYGIIKRKHAGIDQTEAESAEIKGWLRELKLPFEQPTMAEVQELFPQEYGEFLDEIEIKENEPLKKEVTVKNQNLTIEIPLNIGQLREAIKDFKDSDTVVAEIHEGTFHEDLYRFYVDRIDGMATEDGKNDGTEVRFCLISWDDYKQQK